MTFVIISLHLALTFILNPAKLLSVITCLFSFNHESDLFDGFVPLFGKLISSHVNYFNKNHFRSFYSFGQSLGKCFNFHVVE